MVKHLSLLLAGTLAAGALFQSQAAPLARFQGPRSPLAEATQAAGDGHSIDASRIAPMRRIPSASVDITTPVSNLAIANRRALRAATTASRANVSTSMDVFGVVVFDNTWTTSTAKYGVYKLPLTEGGSFTFQGATTNLLYATHDGDHTLYSAQAVYYGTWFAGIDVYIYNTEDWSSRTFYGDEAMLGLDIAYDPITEKIYGCISDGEEAFAWGSLNFNDGTVKKIASLPTGMRGVAISKTGQGYGITTSGDLYKINVTTGAAELVGATGMPALQYMSSAAFDDKDNCIIMTYANDVESGMYQIDPATAQATLITKFANNQEVVGVYVPFAPADKAPGDPSLTVTCPEGAQKADITIVMPSTLADGTDAQGQPMTYKVAANGTEVLTGSANGGETVTTTIDTELTGMVKFVATVSNEAGDSRDAKTNVYIGKAIPQAPANVLLSWADNTFTLTWDAVTEAADEGYFNAAEVVYDIIDSEGNTVAADVAATTWSTAQAEPESFTSFYFSVKAKYAGRTSEAGVSNILSLGSFKPAVTFDLTDEAVFNQHTILNANNDNKTWIYNSKGAQYKYSGSNDADDWLFSPSVYLQAGKAYDFTATSFSQSNSYPEYMEIAMGTECTAEAMTIEIAPRTLITKEPVKFTASLVPTVSGIYHIGFHAVSEAGQYQFWVSDYTISEPYGAAAPDVITGLEIIPDVKGELNAVISFKASTKTVTNNDIEGDMAVDILRDGEKVRTVSCRPGMNINLEDKVPAAGRYTYTFVPLSADDETGRKVSASAYIGPNVPNPPAVINAKENPDKLGEVTLSWEHSTTDVDGNPLYTPNLTYNVYQWVAPASADEEGHWQILNDQPIADTTITVQAQDENADQTFVQFGVLAINKGVSGEYLNTPGLVAVGFPYDLPARLSGPEALDEYIVGLDDTDGCDWGFGQDGKFNEITSQDADGFFFVGERVRSALGTSKGAGDLILGKYDLSTAQHPVVSFYTWKITDTDKSVLEVYALCEGQKTLVKSLNYNDDETAVWTKKTLSLEQFAGKCVQLIFRYYSDGLVYFFMDNMEIREHYDNDLRAASVTGPKKVAIDETFDLSVEVSNEGRVAAEGYTVALLRDGETVATCEGDGIEPGENAFYTFSQSLNAASAAEVTYSAQVIYDADMDLDNNITGKVATVKRELSTLPVVNALSGETTEQGNVLTWNPITAEDIPADATVEDFESAESFAKEVEGWTFVDNDDLPTGGLKNIDIPGFNKGVDHLSFIVFDHAAENFNIKDFEAASGEKFIASIYAMETSSLTPVSHDDWIISPALNGNAQTITFRGKPLSINYTEQIQVRYTTEETLDPNEYEVIEEFNTPGYDYLNVRSDGWDVYSFELPEGATHFAIGVISLDGFMFFLDDIKYIPAGAPTSLQHVGYNVYRDGVKLNAEPLTEATFTDTEATEGDHTYHVTALYNQGESEVSNGLTLTTSGVASVAAGAVKVGVEGSFITVSGAEGKHVAIFAADGKLLVGTTGNTRQAVSAGIYLVTVEKNTWKVVVR